MRQPWAYAELSKLAKQAGDPEKLLKAVEDGGRALGRKDVYPFVAMAFFLGGGVVIGAQKLWNRLAAYDSETISRAEDAKKVIAIEMEENLYESADGELEEEQPDSNAKTAESKTLQ